jgi:hypothetical protein
MIFFSLVFFISVYHYYNHPATPSKPKNQMADNTKQTPNVPHNQGSTNTVMSSQSSTVQHTEGQHSQSSSSSSSSTKSREPDNDIMREPPDTMRIQGLSFSGNTDIPEPSGNLVRVGSGDFIKYLLDNHCYARCGNTLVCENGFVCMINESCPTGADDWEKK